MELAIVMGLATAFNFCILIWKVKRGRILDFIIDCFCMVCICALFSTGVAALAMGMTASMVVSLYLMFFPIKFSNPFRKWWA